MGCRLLRNNKREELSSVHNCSPAVHFWEMADIAGYEVVMARAASAHSRKKLSGS